MKTSLRFSDLPLQSWRCHLVCILDHNFLNGYPAIFLPCCGFMLSNILEVRLLRFHGFWDSYEKVGIGVTLNTPA